MLEGTLDLHLQLFEIEGLQDVVEGARLHRLSRSLALVAPSVGGRSGRIIVDLRQPSRERRVLCASPRG